MPLITSDCAPSRIADGISAADRPPPPGFGWPRPEFPVAFIPADGGVSHGLQLQSLWLIPAAAVS